MDRTDGELDALVVGEALVDIVRNADGETERPGGSPANVALGLGRLGHRVALLTRIAADDRGEAVRRHLGQSDVALVDGSVGAQRTPTAVASIGADGAARYDFDIEWTLPGAEAPPARLVHTGSIAAFLAPGADSVMRIVESARGMVSYDPNIRPALLGPVEEVRMMFERTSRSATLVKLSDEDAGWLYPGVAPGDVLQRILALGPALAAITLGPHGSMLAMRGTDVEIPPAHVDVVDTIGAGDTYMASLIDSLLTYDGPPEDRAALHRMGLRAARAAGVTVGRAGADLPWRHELA